MRKLLSALIVLAAVPCVSWGAPGPQTLLNETGLAYSTSPAQNLNAYGSPQGSAGKISAMITVTSATIAAQTFTDGSQSTTSVQVLSNNLLSAKATNSITLPATAVILGAGATAQIVVTTATPGMVVTINGNTLREGIEWNRDVNFSSMSATNLSAAINLYLASALTANTTNWTTIWTTATVVGTNGNNYTLTSSSPTKITTTTFSGGLNRGLFNQFITFNGDIGRNGVYWTDSSNTSSGTAASIATWMNNYGVIKATSAGSVVFTTATTAGIAANAFTLTASTTNLTIGSAVFTGGQDNASVTINGRSFTAGVDFSTNTLLATIATNLAAAINTATASIGVSAVGTSTAVFSTSTVVGVSTNYQIATSTNAILKIAGPVTVTAGAATGTMTGGTNSSYSLATDVISITNHGFTKALPVLYSTTTVTGSIGGLVWGTTYFVSVVDSNNIRLSTTSASALSGTFIDLTSSNTSTTTRTYTLTPGPFIQGNFSGKWQVSNDGSNWADFLTTAQGIAVSSQPITVFAPVFGSSTVVQDFGFIDYGYLRYNVLGPTQGGALLKVILNAKD